MLDAHKVFFSVFEKANIEKQLKECEKGIKKKDTQADLPASENKDDEEPVKKKTKK